MAGAHRRNASVVISYFAPPQVTGITREIRRGAALSRGGQAAGQARGLAAPENRDR
jgi:hypothetical protein